MTQRLDGAENSPPAQLVNDAPTLRVEAPQAEGITWRAILLGLFLTVFIAAVTVQNDNVMHNTYLVGNHLPLTVVAVITVLAVVVNPVLGRRRLTHTEMTVAIGMMLISCALPSSGFFRYFLTTLVVPVFFTKDTPWYADYIKVLPDWLVPSKDAASMIVQGFNLGLDARRGENVGATWESWWMVYGIWAFFLVPVFLAVVLFCALMRKQWVVHERLAFPLASIPLLMMAPPESGSRWNALWKSRLLWIGVAIPLCIHLLNGMARFYPDVPEFPMKYDLASAMSEVPWRNLNGAIKSSRVFFSVIGVTYFIPLEIAFSLWFFFFIYQVGRMFLDRTGILITAENETYQGLGIFVAYGVMLLFLARHHFMHIARSLGKPREPDEYLSYGKNLLALGSCILVAAGFLATAYGDILSLANWGLGILIVLAILFYGMVLTRLAIDAGVLMIQVPAGAEAMRAIGMIFHANKGLLTLRQWFVSTMATQVMLTDQRETMMPFAANALRVGGNVPGPSRTRFLILLIVALFTCLIVSGATHHVMSYTLGRQGFDDGHGPVRFPRLVMNLTQENAQPDIAPPKINRPMNVVYGALALTGVGVMRLMWTACPIHPIGLLMFNNWAVGQIWFSIFLCWMVKAVILKWGGVGVYQSARSFFIGLLVGESLAGVMWIIVGFVVPWPNVLDAYQVLPH